MDLNLNIEFLRHRTGETVEKIKKLINQQIKELSGLIDEEGALVIITKNLLGSSTDITGTKFVSPSNIVEFIEQKDKGKGVSVNIICKEFGLTDQDLLFLLRKEIIYTKRTVDCYSVK